MNKSTITALGIAVVALVVAGFSFFTGGPKLGSYVPPVQSAGGFVASYATSTAYTLSCTPQNVQWLGTSAVATGTINAATSTFASCPNLDNLGTSVGGLVVNDSTNTVNYTAGTGVVFKCETSGVGTSTVVGGCSATGFSILASSTIQENAFFDSSSSSLIVVVGNNFK
jgi:hypothetical protein